ncbi:MAG: hypothetical protein JNK05_28855 [Myxococcales bacterium]|nr:hypothetical protein [Myxococcales bacterium]
MPIAVRPRSRVLFSALLGALSLTACTRTPAPQVEPGPPRARASQGDSTPVVAEDAAMHAASSDVAALATDAAAEQRVPPLFAAMPCAAIIAQRATTQERAGHLTIGQRELSTSELHQRPWLWGQSGSGCARQSFVASPDDTPATVDQGTTEARARAIAQHYLSWGRVDDEVRWAPFLCRLPMGARPRADLDAQAAPHGRKVYYLYARERIEYITGRMAPASAQIVVKEAWRPREIARSEAVHASMSTQCVGTGDRCVEPGDFAGLYIMMRHANRPATERTDDGWTYATVDPQGTVTASGVIESCAGCHRRAPHGRLFGITGHHGA